MATREILPRVGYAKQELHWTCPGGATGAAPARSRHRLTPRIDMAKTFKNFIAGEWVAPSTDAYFDNRNPADTARPDRAVPRFRSARTWTRRSARPSAGLRSGPERPAPAQRRRAPPGRRPAGRAKGSHRQRDDAGDGQGPGRDPGRRAGGDRHRVLRGHRGTPALRPGGSFGAPLQVGHELPPADRRGRADHAVQLPAGHPDLEDVPRAALRELGDHQALRGCAPHGAPPGRDPAGGRPSSRGHPAGARPRRDGGQGPGRASGGSGHLLHRLDRDRGPDRGNLRADAQAAVAGDGGQERHDRHGRRRPRSGARGRALGRVRHHGAALHRHQPPDPPQQGPRSLSQPAVRCGRGAEAGRWAGRTRPTWAR